MRKQNEKGITLIALVITIIVLLILAGVAINMLAGDNGILRQAAKAKEETEKASMEEKIQLAVLAATTEGLGDVDYATLNTELSKLGFDRGTETDGVYPNDVKELPATIEIDGKYYQIQQGGKTTQIGWWRYKEDENGRKTIVTNGEDDLPIGTYINYNAAAKDADEKEIEEKTETSNAGSPTATGYYKGSDQTLTEGNGSGTYTFKNTTNTNGWRVLGVKEETGEILIIAADSAGNLNLRGIAGYTYGESELNKICGVYGSGYGATGARSVNIDDVNKITGYNPNNEGKYDPSQSENGIKYGFTGSYEYENEVKYSWTSTANQVSWQGLKNNKNGTDSNSNYATYGFNWYDKEEKNGKTQCKIQPVQWK